MYIKTIIADQEIIFSKNLAREIDKTRDFCVVATTDKGHELLDNIEIFQPSLVIMDANLEELCGLSLLQKISKLETKPKILVLSNCSSPRFVNSLYSSGANAFLRKPCNALQILHKIEEMFKLNEPAQVHIENSLEMEISYALQELAVSPHLLGYRYLREAIILVIEDYSIIHSKTKVLYPKVAEKFNSSPSKVERAIRNAIETTWQKAKGQALRSYFPTSLSDYNKRPTNGEFIATLAECFKIDRQSLLF